MLEELDSLLDLPFQIVDRSIATCGSSEFGQTGLEEAAVVPIDQTISAKPALKSVVCGGWSTILNYSDGSQTVLGLNHEREPVRRFQVTDMSSNPVSHVAVGDTFWVLLRPDKTVNVIGELPIRGEKATKVFAKFGMAAIVTPEKTVSVVYTEYRRAIRIVLPDGEAPHTVEPLGQDGVFVLSNHGRLFAFPDFADRPSVVFEKVVSVASTRRRSIFLQSDGRIYEVVQGEKIQISGVSGLPIKVFAGGAHLGCVTFEGTAFTWGTGTFGQLGTGTFLNTETPKEVKCPTAKKILDAAAGEEHTAFVIVPQAKFAQLIPRIMLSEPVPAGVAALSVIPYGFVPPEFDMKF